MEHILILVRLLLAVVLTVAGSAKLVDRPGTRRAFVSLGGPAPIAPMAAWLLPFFEIAAALALLSSGASAAGAVAASVLFALFTGALAIAVARGGTADCHCFGQLSASPVSWRTLIRTLVLTGLAGVLIYASPAGISPGVASWLGASLPPGLASSVVLLAAVGAITWTVALARESQRREVTLAERIAVLERRLAEHPPGTGAPPKAQAPDDGLPVGAPAPGPLALLPFGRPALILFVSSSCPPCMALLSEVATWRAQLGEAATLVVLTRDDEKGAALAEAYRARWTPAGVLVGAAGRIASPLRYGIEAVNDLFGSLRDSIADGAIAERALHHQLGSRLGTATLVVGDPAPASELVDASSRERLLLFWDPGCTYCQGMAGELKAFEAAPPAGAPSVAFVVPRDADGAGVAQAAFSSPSYFDPDSRIAPLFGARGTPSAVLIDGDGRIASMVAVGKDAILSLLAPLPARSARGGTL